MPIAESEISIIIPTYRYQSRICRSVESALASNAGEIIVVDDASKDGTIELLARYRDPRLKVYENSVNLGLWENHLCALKYSTGKWIKFIQADDYLAPGGLSAFSRSADESVAVLSAIPIMKNDVTGSCRTIYRLDKQLTVDCRGLAILCLCAGWVLGTPSHMMFKRSALSNDPSIWRRSISADFIAGALAATKGLVKILPPGPIFHAEHPGQDSNTQGFELAMRRFLNSLIYMRSTQDPCLRFFVNCWISSYFEFPLKLFLRAIRDDRRSILGLVNVWRRFFISTELSDFLAVIRLRRLSYPARCYRAENAGPVDLEEIFKRVGAIAK